jgi:signal transduction histidine kinase
MVNTTTVFRDGKQFILSSLSPGRAQKRLALAVAFALLVTFFVTIGPLSTIRLARIDAFVPAYATAIFLNNSITAVLLFAQFSILHSRAHLVIASAYLFTSLMLIPWVLTFPGVFAPSGLLGAGLQSTAWLYILWHAGFAMLVIRYTLLKDAGSGKRLWRSSARAAILLSVAVTAAVVCAATFLVIAGDSLLPRIMVDAVRDSPLWVYAAGCLALLSGLALIVLRVRWHSVLDLWLMVVMCAHVTELCLSAFFSTRFSIGWYVGRASGLLSGSLVLIVLLYETTRLYAQLFGVVLAQRREYEARLVTADTVTATIAHEVKQPLSGIVTSADAGFRWVDRSVPDLDEAKAAFMRIVADGRRAAAVIESIRAMVKKGDLTRTALDINGLIGGTLALVGSDLQKHGILVQTELNAKVPQVIGEPIQLQQVLLNLITNAIDAMTANDEARILSVKSDNYADGGVKISVADTRTGIGWHDIARQFDPYSSGQSDGRGISLSICRSIIEAHNGRIWVVPNKPRGAVFQFVLLAGGATYAADASRVRQPDGLPSRSRI